MIIEQGVDNLQLIVFRQAEVEGNQPPQANDDLFVLDGYQRSLPLLEIFDVVRNDSDPDGDFMKVTQVAQPKHGLASSLSSHTIVYQLEKAQATDSFDYTITDTRFFDSELSDSATVEIYIDCACTVLCLNSLEGPPSVSTQTTDEIDLPLIYQVRDQVLQETVDGRRYIDMYYNSNPEILVNILQNESLRAEALATVELWQEPLRNLTEGDGATQISQAQVDALEQFLDHLSDLSGDELQGLIDAELQRLGPLDHYVGMSMKEATKEAIGDPALHLPSVYSKR